jgi:hypothetical protein
VPSLQEVIIKMERLYAENQNKVVITKRKEPELHAKPTTLRKKGKAKAKPKAANATLTLNPPPKRTKKQILLGTDIAGYYYDMEMQAHNEKVGTDISQAGNGSGKWYRGTVIGERWTEQNKLVYECQLNTPLQHVRWYT